MSIEILCPACASGAIYKYGKLPNGQQRYLCQVCNRQFSLSSSTSNSEDRPQCPACGANMHVYKRENRVVRYRCSRYPECKTFEKKTRRP